MKKNVKLNLEFLRLKLFFTFELDDISNNFEFHYFQSLNVFIFTVKRYNYNRMYIFICPYTLQNHIQFQLFSSPELKAQVSFSDRLSSVVCLSVCLSVCKLFLFSTSSPEPLGQFQPNLAQSILGWRGIKFVQMKAPAFFKGEIITKKRK